MTPHSGEIDKQTRSPHRTNIQFLKSTLAHSMSPPKKPQASGSKGKQPASGNPNRSGESDDKSGKSKRDGIKSGGGGGKSGGKPIRVAVRFVETALDTDTLIEPPLEDAKGNFDKIQTDAIHRMQARMLELGVPTTKVNLHATAVFTPRKLKEWKGEAQTQSDEPLHVVMAYKLRAKRNDNCTSFSSSSSVFVLNFCDSHTGKGQCRTRHSSPECGLLYAVDLPRVGESEDVQRTWQDAYKNL